MGPEPVRREDFEQTLEAREGGDFGTIPLSRDEQARLADDPVERTIEGVRVAQAEPTSRIIAETENPIAETPKPEARADVLDRDPWNNEHPAQDPSDNGYEILWTQPKNVISEDTRETANWVRENIENARPERARKLIQEELPRILSWVAVSADSEHDFDDWVTRNGFDAPEYGEAVDFTHRYRRAPSAYLAAEKTTRFADFGAPWLISTLVKHGVDTNGFSRDDVFWLVDSTYRAFAHLERAQELDSDEERARLIRIAGAEFGIATGPILEHLWRIPFLSGVVRDDYSNAEALIAAIREPIVATLPEAERDAFLEGVREPEAVTQAKRVSQLMLPLLPSGRGRASWLLRNGGHKSEAWRDPRAVRMEALDRVNFIDARRDAMSGPDSTGARKVLSREEFAKNESARLKRQPAPQSAEALLGDRAGLLPDGDIVGKDGYIYRKNNHGLYVRRLDDENYAIPARPDQVELSGARPSYQVMGKLEGFELERVFSDATGLGKNRDRFSVPLGGRRNVMWTIPDFWSIARGAGGMIEVTRQRKLSQKMTQVRRQMRAADQEDAPYNLVITPEVEVDENSYRVVMQTRDLGHPRKIYVFDPETYDLYEFRPPKEWKK